jgi:hypothetical protein
MVNLMSNYMMQRTVIVAITILLLTTLLPAISTVHARSIGGQIVDEITATEVDGTLEIRIDFLYPLHYQWRFPKGFNNQIMISLQPVKKDPSLSAIQREDIRVPNQIADLFQEIYIDTTESPNLLLYLQTSKHINPDIIQARGANGIIISLAKDQIKASNNSGCNEGSSKE